ncbi:MAG: hypothetical protein AAF251_15325 [Pseudomonadota bacterium]
MTKKETRAIGSGITRRQESAPIPWDKEETAAELIEALEGALRDVGRLWGTGAKLIELARAELDALESDLAERGIEFDAYDAHFKKHESYGWYLRRLVTYATHAELAIKNGRPSDALELAMLVGETFSEFRLKEAWDGFVEKAQEIKRRQAQGPKSRAKHSKYLRYQSVCADLEKGVSKSQAFRVVAKRLRVSASTVKAYFYVERKSYSQ